MIYLRFGSKQHDVAIHWPRACRADDLCVDEVDVQERQTDQEAKVGETHRLFNGFLLVCSISNFGLAKGQVYTDLKLHLDHEGNFTVDINGKLVESLQRATQVGHEPMTKDLLAE